MQISDLFISFTSTNNNWNSSGVNLREVIDKADWYLSWFSSVLPDSYGI